MPKYILAYDIREGHDYDRLSKELEAFSAIHIQQSVWIMEVSTKTSAAELCALFRSYMAPDDSLVVAEYAEGTSVGPDGKPRAL